MKNIWRISRAGVALALGACSFEVTNPGPVDDKTLDNPGAYQALVTGVIYNVARAVTLSAYYGGAAAKEIGTAGRVIGTAKLPIDYGQLTVDDMSANQYTRGQAARWQAEDGQRRLREVLGAGFNNNKFAGQLLMWGAAANRGLGEAFCEAVIDGGAKQPYTEYFTRALAQATEAIAVAGAANDFPTRDAARAIRASIYLYTGNFAAADADAAAVPLSLVLKTPFDETTQNILVESNDRMIGGSFRSTTVWRTFYDGYYRATGDPRVFWDSSSVLPAERFSEFTGTYWYRQQKYQTRGAAINIATGREMRLVRAEVALRNNDISGALGHINAIRTVINSRFTGNPPLAARTATTLDEGWTALKQERGIELWLEGRRMFDLRRWNDDAVTRANGLMEDITNRIRMCMPLTRGERNTNANLSQDPDDPVSPFYQTVGGVAGTHRGGSNPNGDDWAY